MLRVKNRIGMPVDARVWRRGNLEQGVIEIAVDGTIGIRAAELVDFHGDPVDRLIVATGLEGHRLLTADRRVLGWPGGLSRLDATM